MRNFNVIRICAYTGAASLFDSELTEQEAWDRSFEMEQRESVKYNRRYWYAVTAAPDWKDLAKDFVRYRRSFVLP
jgi:hypothetical protein